MVLPIPGVAIVAGAREDFLFHDSIREADGLLDCRRLVRERPQRKEQSTAFSPCCRDQGPSLSDPHFMEAHALATSTALLPQKNVMVRTMDTGGAEPVSGLLEARRMVGCTVVAGAAVSSLDTAEFLARADQGFNRESGLASPCILHGYNRVAEWQMGDVRVRDRGQLALFGAAGQRQRRHLHGGRRR